MTDTFDELCVKLTQSVEEGINFLRVEASEIIAFLATDNERIVKPGIPPHHTSCIWFERAIIVK